MKRLVRILTLHSVSDLFRYKSFFLLVFFLFVANKLLRTYVHVDKSALNLSAVQQMGMEAAGYLFAEFPEVLLGWLSDVRTLLVLIALFFLKQIVSMWPSSDMRRMHRDERPGFGVLASLFAIQKEQILWDAIAVSTISAIVGGWIVLAFIFCRAIWIASGTVSALVLFAGLSLLPMPIGMAGFSYSSKLAVIRAGTFGQKLALFFKMFTDRRVFIGSFLFFLLRIVVEVLFVAVVPAGAILFIDHFLLRILVAGLSATPVYSFLKMASFKFFLDIYRPFSLVRDEYAGYYAKYDLL